MADDTSQTQRKAGYLACVDNVPPLIFRFQMNPDILSEKRTYRYQEEQQVGQWQIKNAESAVSGAALALAATAFPSAALPGIDNLKNYSAALVCTRPLNAVEGEPRVFAIDF